jgi:hypothetical protein
MTNAHSLLNFLLRDTPIWPVPSALDLVSLFPDSSRPDPTPRPENFAKSVFKKSPALGKLAGEGCLSPAQDQGGPVLRMERNREKQLPGVNSSCRRSGSGL